MSENETLRSSEVTVDLDTLYKEEVFTDTRAATIRRMSPVLKDGSPDSGRPVLFVGFPVQPPRPLAKTKALQTVGEDRTENRHPDPASGGHCSQAAARSSAPARG